mgnify:CR=1 FL=1
MNKTFLLSVFTIIFFANICAKESPDTTIIKHNNNSYFFVSNGNNESLIIFLHGGLSNPYFINNPENIALDYLLEGSKVFIQSTIENKFDVLIPITNDSLNWVGNSAFCYRSITDVMASTKKEYKEIYISGFSDGGTGSYKLFYENQNFFDGLIVFNGYPQLDNFNNEVNYSTVIDKPVIYFGTKADKTIPYEFMLTEYIEQKQYNPNTYIYLANGGHSFSYYNLNDFNTLFDILKGSSYNLKTEPIHGFVKNDQLVYFYKFRKSIMRKYSYGKEYYTLNKKQMGMYK